MLLYKPTAVFCTKGTSFCKVSVFADAVDSVKEISYTMRPPLNQPGTWEILDSTNGGGISALISIQLHSYIAILQIRGSADLFSFHLSPNNTSFSSHEDCPAILISSLSVASHQRFRVWHSSDMVEGICQPHSGLNDPVHKMTQSSYSVSVARCGKCQLSRHMGRSVNV